MKDKGRWITIAGRHIFVEEGETPMSAYVKHMAGKNKNKTSRKNEMTDEEVKGFNRQISNFSKKIDEEIKNFGGVENIKKQMDKNQAEEKEELARQTKARREFTERFSSDKYSHIKGETKSEPKSNIVKVAGENVIVKGDEKPIAAFIRNKVEGKQKKRIYNEEEIELAKANIDDKRKALGQKLSTSFKTNEIDSSNINEKIQKARSSSQATKALNKYLNSNPTEGMNSTEKYKENKYGVKDQALLHDENKNPSGSWIPTKQAMITYYKKRAKEENNQYYSDNAERLAEEYIKYREELKRKGRN